MQPSTVDRKREVQEMFLARYREVDVAIEVGVWDGRHAQLIQSVISPGELHLIDPWQWEKQWHHNQSAESIREIESGRPTQIGDQMFERVSGLFADADRVHIYRESSFEAVGRFADGSVDWIFIDGDHRYEAVQEDLHAWWPKVRKGGTLCGDDFRMPGYAQQGSPHGGVAQALDEFAAEHWVEVQLIPQVSIQEEDGSRWVSYQYAIQKV